MNRTAANRYDGKRKASDRGKGAPRAMPETPGSILVIEDDPNVAELIRLYLDKAGHEVRVAADGIEGLRLFRERPPDLVVLDVMLPFLDGWEVCREIRRQGQTPVILLTARGEGGDKLLGFELGADDYVVKPFDPQELMARVRAVLRRSRPETARETVVRHPGLVVDLGRYRAEVDGTPVELPRKEMELLHFLARHPHRVFTREQLLSQVWGYDFPGDTRTVDVHVKRLRKKLEAPGRPWRIATVWGVGYKFEVAGGGDAR